jgi:hypothetical protein
MLKTPLCNVADGLLGVVVDALADVPVDVSAGAAPAARGER